MSWLANILKRGYGTLQINGVALPQEYVLNIATGAVGVDDPTNARTTLTITSLIAPTGTGFVHITGGGTDPAARAVNLASADVTGALGYTNGGTGLSALGSNGQVLAIVAGAPAWAGVPAITSLTGDVVASGTGAVAATVEAIQGESVSNTTPSAGQVFVYNGSWFPVTIIGDASLFHDGTITVSSIHGATVPAAGTAATGNGLHVSAPGTLVYSSLNLAGGSNYVTGALPVANFAHGTAGQLLLTNSGATAPVWVSLSGDVTISASGVATVDAVNGASVPAGGSLTTGNVLQVSGSSALTYGPVNLANANSVTGDLSVANIAPGAAGQVPDHERVCYGGGMGERRELIQPAAGGNPSVVCRNSVRAVPPSHVDLHRRDEHLGDLQPVLRRQPGECGRHRERHDVHAGDRESRRDLLRWYPSLGRFELG